MFSYLTQVKKFNNFSFLEQHVLKNFCNSSTTTTFANANFIRFRFAIDLIIGISFVIASIILTYTLKQNQINTRIKNALLLIGTLEIGAVLGALVFTYDRNELDIEYYNDSTIKKIIPSYCPSFYY